jgi:hypothetical protein
LRIHTEGQTSEEGTVFQKKKYGGKEIIKSPSEMFFARSVASMIGQSYKSTVLRNGQCDELNIPSTLTMCSPLL